MEKISSDSDSGSGSGSTKYKPRLSDHFPIIANYMINPDYISSKR
jgi:hypothetical protein